MELLGRGQDHVTYLADADTVVRFACGDGAAERVERDARLLAFVADLTDVATPRPTAVDSDAGSISYRRLPGVPLLELEPEIRNRAAQAVGPELGRLLKALHAVDPERARGLVEVDDQPPAGWLEDAAGEYEVAGAAIPDVHRGAVEQFLRAVPPARGTELVFSHNDLGIEHVLVDPDSLAVTGIIDWSDAALCDPAQDFGLILRDLGEPALAAAFAAYERGERLSERAHFYARCALLEDLAYGLSGSRDEYTSKSIAALDWLF